MLISGSQLAQANQPYWFCLRTERKREPIAAASAAQLAGVETFCPLIRFQKLTRRGVVWFQEALFPCYFFARFLFGEKHRFLLSLPGVRSLVCFGQQYGVVEDHTIAHLRAATGDQKVIIVDPVPQPGDSVRFTQGAFQGLEAIVSQYLPEKDRVKTLLTLLGRQVEIETGKASIISRCELRSAIAKSENVSA